MICKIQNAIREMFELILQIKNSLVEEVVQQEAYRAARLGWSPSSAGTKCRTWHVLGFPIGTKREVEEFSQWL